MSTGFWIMAALDAGILVYLWKKTEDWPELPETETPWNSKDKPKILHFNPHADPCPESDREWEGSPFALDSDEGPWAA